MKRIVFFLVTNLAVMLVLGIWPVYLASISSATANGLNLGLLLGLPL